MKVFITNLYGVGGTATKAQNDVTNIVRRDLQYGELGIYCYMVESDSEEMLRTRLDGIISSVGSGDVVVLQTPTWNNMLFEEKLMDKLNARVGAKKIVFIHDVIPLMFQNWVVPLSRYIDLYNRADLLIAPSQAMVDFLRSNGLTVKKVVIQRMWDCVLSVDSARRPQFKKVLNFAGNPNKDAKLAFVREWKYDNVQLAVTVDNGDWAQDKNIRFLGWFNNDNLLAEALRNSGGFGLLWSENPYWREYMKKNASYKFSTYLAAGIPVIVPSGIAEEETVIRKNLGLVVDSLDEAVERIEQMSEDEYNKMVESVESVAYLLREGYFTKKALTDAVFKLLYE